jgi:hypothetical protein
MRGKRRDCVYIITGASSSKCCNVSNGLELLTRIGVEEMTTLSVVKTLRQD